MGRIIRCCDGAMRIALVPKKVLPGMNDTGMGVVWIRAVRTSSAGILLPEKFFREEPFPFIATGLLLMENSCLLNKSVIPKLNPIKN